MVVASLLIVLGFVIYFGAAGMSALGSVFPMTIAAALIVFSAVLIVMNLRRPVGRAAKAVEMTTGTKHRFALGAIMLGWVILMPEIGFLVCSMIAFVAIMFVADYDRPPLKTWMIWIVTGLLICFGFWWLMSNVLLLRMPAGLLI